MADGELAAGITRRRALAGSAAVAAAGLGTAMGGSTAAASPSGGPSREVMERIKNGGRARLRELGITIGDLPTGRFNAITDVPGVKVGSKTLIFDDPGIARTGVTLVIPRPRIWENHCYAAIYSHNGNGEFTGSHWLEETGWLTSAIGITNTDQVGIVRDSLVKIEAEQNPDLSWRLPVVGETYDGRFNDIHKFWVREKHVREAWSAAKGGAVAEGNVGGGTGMSFFGHKGGTGTSSRVVRVGGRKYTVGVLVQSNFGRKDDLRVNGAPVGKELPEPGKDTPKPAPTKSCIIVVGTDAPMLADQCKRLATRAGIGLARVGGIASNGDGDIYLAFSTGNDIPVKREPVRFTQQAISNDEITPFFDGVIEATQEALLNSATMAKTLAGLDGRVKYALPLDRMVEAMKKYNLYG